MVSKLMARGIQSYDEKLKICLLSPHATSRDYLRWFKLTQVKEMRKKCIKNWGL